VYWGSHGCHLPYGHTGPHLCHCAKPNWHAYLPEGYYNPDTHAWNVGAPPYYGPETNFYGEDAETLGLRSHDNPQGRPAWPLL
jgi:hypothetical protein